MNLKLGRQHRVLEYFQVCSNHAPGLTLTYFTTRSNLVPYDFVWEKNTMDFSEIIVVITETSPCAVGNFRKWLLYKCFMSLPLIAIQTNIKFLIITVYMDLYLVEININYS